MIDHRPPKKVTQPPLMYSCMKILGRVAEKIIENNQCEISEHGFWLIVDIHEIFIGSESEK